MKNWKNGKVRFHYSDGGTELSYSVQVTKNGPGLWKAEASIANSSVFAVYSVKAESLAHAQAMVEKREMGGILGIR